MTSHVVLGDWAAFPPQRPGTARFAGRCVSNEQDQKCLSGSVDRSGDNIVSLGTDDRDSKACTEQERNNQTLSEKLGQTHG